MIANNLIAIVAFFVLFVTVKCLPNDGKCFAQIANPDVTIEKLSKSGRWYVHKTEQLGNCSHITFHPNSQKADNGFLLVTTMRKDLEPDEWPAPIKSIFYLENIQPGVYYFWPTEEMKILKDEPSGKATFLAYNENRAFVLVFCNGSNVYFTATRVS
ncbi:hypothetical protein CHUAL_008179 [Chamberlinius hualienensis]